MDEEQDTQGLGQDSTEESSGADSNKESLGQKIHKGDDSGQIPKSKTKDSGQGSIWESKWLAGLVGVLLLALVAGAIYLALGLNRGGSEEVGQQAATDTETESSKLPGFRFSQFENIYYVHGPDFDQPGAVYSRAFTGGDRTELKSLSAVEDIDTNRPNSTVSRVYSFVHNQREIWLGQDGEKPQKIYTLERGDRIISGLVPNLSGDQLAFAVAPNRAAAGGSSSFVVSVWTINSDGTEATKVADNTHQEGPFWLEPFQWSRDGQKLYLQAEGHSGGGPGPAPKTLNLKTGTLQPLTPIKNFSGKLAGYAVNPTGTYLAYLEATEDSSLPFGFGPPYTLKVRDLESGEEQKVETFDKNPPELAWYFDAENNLAYSQGSKLFTYNVDTQNSDLSFDTTGPKITTLHVVSSGQALFSERQDGENVVYHSVDLEAKSSQPVMTGTDITELVGITYSQ